jgi:transposase
VRYWLHSTDKADKPEEFAEKVNTICEAYHQATENYTNNIHTVSVDEMTGIQALERIHPDKPVTKGRAACVEFEYERHGTTTLIAPMEIATGEIIFPYLNQTRKEEDYLAVIKNVVSSAPEHQWIFINDGLNTHKSESLVRFVAESCGITDDLGVKNKSGILQNMKSRADFLSNPEHRIRFIYTPKHCSWLNQIEIWFSILARRLLKRMSYKSVDELCDSIKIFIQQYNLTAKAFAWTYKGIPLSV